ncbi:MULTISPECIES: cellulose biosynthesis protein BcsE [unclassified Serratia (in: enterobacteria)]|uniref:cellulose biosynthesis protein BcsE n=1 Tax=unclassified Serratia (in: enterobacteria) TaxID=2647522 RepID=UPI000502C992|nr:MULTISPECIES: cellulose biosynthesis protein BcsE [unclassified Serratia (in: enterobacteria)]KFK93686.1 cellulose biosynthesis protein BcsE [Serratia sp. Ag2]KFK98949.1 cellulose biosynthesis protein BcsE [Serratia sp. Ag1]
MAHSFLLGIRQIWEELSVMQSPGFYWVNVDRQIDANLLCRQIITAQTEDSLLALICSHDKPSHLLADLPSPAIKKLPLYTLPDKKTALLFLRDDLMRTLHPKNRLLILLAQADLWQTFTDDELRVWSYGLAKWLRQRQCTLILLSYGSGVNKLKDRLSAEHRILNGLANLQWQQDSAQYLVNWWSTANCINANQLMTLYPTPEGWLAQEEEKTTSSPTRVVSDAGRYLAERSILEGAPPLSVNWKLFENSVLLTQHGMQAMAATLIYALYQSDQVEILAHQIHSLRRQRGNGLKIVVREMSASLRYSDERLLLACGASLIVPHIAPLSSFLTMLEGVQGQRLSRYIPVNIDALLAGLRPLPVKGYLPLEDFSKAVVSLLENTLLPEDGKGVMVALRPVPGLSARQSMTLCHQRRFGDIMTVAQNRLFLFLSTCRINDLDTALKFIFRLPVREAFSNWVVWYEDVDILSEIKRLAQNMELAQSTLKRDLKSAPKTAATVEDVPTEERRQPIPITLLSHGQKE